MHKTDFSTIHLILFLLFLGSLIPFSACTSRKIIANEPVVRDTGDTHLVNINRDDASALQSLPNVGPVLAEKIVEHRTRYGPFRKIEHILLIEGVSDKRFREIRHLIAIE